MTPTLHVHSYESFGAVDGPGIRLVVFLQGCPLRCLFCHNPDTWSPQGGTETTIPDLVSRAVRMRPYLGQDGGVTFSGGEPLLQAKPLLAAIQALHDEGFHVAVDTSGGVDTPDTRAVLDAADLILLDVKSPTQEGFRAVTGADPAPYWRNLDHLRSTQKPIWVRQVVAHGLNDTPAEKDATRALLQGLNVQRIDRLPYHELGVHKYEALGIPYPGAHLRPPSPEELKL